MLVLGIETTCDETACAIVKDGREILSNIVFSQTNIHEEFGGVVPELACRRHVDVLIPVIQAALQEAHCDLQAIDLFAVASQPGLIGALLIGLNAAKTLALSTQKPFIGVNHVEAHLYAAIMSNPDVHFPALGVVLSGGHTHLIKMHEIGNYELIGQTVDDAVGEAFDKVAKMMSLPYPGGPIIEKLAQRGDPYSYPFKAGTVKGRPFDFSFSGLKTAVLYANPSTSEKSNLAASFQQAAFTDIVHKTISAAQHFSCKTLVFGGGVTQNQALRKLFSEKGCQFLQLWPSGNLSLDNAAMIAGLGYQLFKLKGQSDLFTHDAGTTLPWTPKF